MNNTALRAEAQSANNTHMVRKKVLKIRLMGTKNDIKWFEKILRRQPKVAVTEFSELFPNKGTSKFYRAYVEVHKSNIKEK